MFGFLKKIFGTAQTRMVKKFRGVVAEINAWDEKFNSLTDDELKAKTTEFRQRVEKGESLDSILPEAYAVVKNACRRLVGTDVHIFGYDQKWDMVPYDVQLIGAIALHKGCITEMQTGEGKTLTATLPLYLNAMTQKPVHLVTVNDYLAQRDCEWMGTVFKWLGLTVGAVTQGVAPFARKGVYASDIVYGTASEFGFDYLRDNSLANSKEQQVQRGHYFAIIDEVDSILIDEARTPLIISGPVNSSRQMYDELKEGVALVVKLQRDLCNKLATEARKTLEKYGWFKEFVEGEKPAEKKLSKEEQVEEKAAIHKLWLVSKGTPHHKILSRAKENPELREAIDYWDTYYHAEHAKEEKIKALSELFVVVEERSSEYELTDKGINAWVEYASGSPDDFIMLDLGHEVGQIERDSELSDEEKKVKRVALQDEDARRKERAHNLRQLLRAHLLMEKDVDYIVQEGKVVIIDENTGRPQPGRRFSEGLHQAIEAKENLAIQKETQTYATITLQNFFRLYDKLAGMSGTVMTEAAEFKEIYKLEALEIPTHKPCNRKDFDDEVYMTEREKYQAILKEVNEVHGKGRPILIGTESVEVSEKLSRIFKLNKLPHTVLNAKYNDKEAEIIADAGQEKAITISTNMAGRGTDIKLKPGVAQLGGLHVIGTTRHQSRRIDRQLRGRSARLGDPGSSKFFICFEDSLMRLFASPRVNALIKRFRPPEGEPISAGILNKAIETAQKRVETRNYTIRKHTLEYDDVMNKHRQEVYAYRGDLLHAEDPVQFAKELIEDIAIEIVSQQVKEIKEDGVKDPSFLKQEIEKHFPIALPKEIEQVGFDEKALSDIVAKTLISAFSEKIEIELQKVPQEALYQVVRGIILRKIDHLWQEHLLIMDNLRADVSMRVVGQKDPLIEFKQEAFLRFDEFSKQLKQEVARDLFRFEIALRQQEQEKAMFEQLISQLKLEKERSFTEDFESQKQPQEVRQVDVEEKPQPILSGPRINRNDDCPCGSGKKYKKCCIQSTDSGE